MSRRSITGSDARIWRMAVSRRSRQGTGGIGSGQRAHQAGGGTSVAGGGWVSVGRGVGGLPAASPSAPSPEVSIGRKFSSGNRPATSAWMPSGAREDGMQPNGLHAHDQVHRAVPRRGDQLADFEAASAAMSGSGQRAAGNGAARSRGRRARRSPTPSRRPSARGTGCAAAPRFRSHGVRTRRGNGIWRRMSFSTHQISYSTQVASGSVTTSAPFASSKRCSR